MPGRATIATTGVQPASFGVSSRPSVTVTSSSTATATMSTQCGTDDDVWVAHEGAAAAAASGAGLAVAMVSFGTQCDGEGGHGVEEEVKVDSDDGEHPSGLGYRYFSAVDDDVLGDEVDALGAAFSCLADAESLFDSV